MFTFIPLIKYSFSIRFLFQKNSSLVTHKNNKTEIISNSDLKAYTKDRKHQHPDREVFESTKTGSPMPVAVEAARKMR